MILINAQGLGRQYAGDPIFTDLAFEIRAGERIGLVGPNGAGKTTLMKLLDRTEQPEYGKIYVRPAVRVSLLRQEPDFETDQTLMEVARSGLSSLLDLQRELEEAAQEMAEADDDHDRERAGKRYDELHEQLEHQDAYSIDHRVEEILSGLGFAGSEFERPASTFSGGQQSRLMLAKLLLESPDPDGPCPGCPPASRRGFAPPDPSAVRNVASIPMPASGGGKFDRSWMQSACEPL